MKMRNVWIKLVAAVFASGGLLAPADTIDIKFAGLGAHSNVKISIDSKTLYGGAGVCLFDKVGGEGEISSYWEDGSKTFFGFCTDLHQYVSSSESTYTLIDVADGPDPGGPIGEEKANFLKELWAEHFDISWVNSGSYTPQQNYEAAAFGLLVWEIVYEDLGDWDLSSGHFKVINASSSVLDIANDWLGSLDGQGPYANLVTFTSPIRQDMLTQIPEPATIGFILTGLVLFIRRK